MFEGQITPSEWRFKLLKLEQLTSDPSNPQPGDEWLRVDQKPSYTDANGNTRTAVAQYRRVRQDGTTITVPVAQLGDATDSKVIDKVRANVSAGGSPTGKGFVPFAKTGASYPKRKLQHPVDGEVGLHDALTARVIPDSGLEHRYKSSDLSLSDGDAVSSWSDRAGSATLSQSTGSKQPIYQTSVIGGNPVVRFDGVDDLLSATYSSTISQGNERIVIAKLNETDSEETILDGGTNNEQIVWGSSSNNEWRIFAGSTLQSGVAIDTNAHLLDGVYNGSNSTLYIDGSAYSGSVGGNDLTGITVGARDDETHPGAVDVAEIIEYSAPLTSSERSDLEAYVSNEYGINIA